MDYLMAVDLGVRTGLAVFGSDGRLYWYRSQNFGTAARLRRAVPWILSLQDDLRYIVIEGGGPLLKIWESGLRHTSVELIRIMAEDWRNEIFYPKEHQNRRQSKANSVYYAMRAVHQLAVHRITPVDDNTADAILAGLYGMKLLGWIDNPREYLR